MRQLRRLRILPSAAKLLLWLIVTWLPCSVQASLFDRGERYFESFDALEPIGADIIIDIQQDADGFIWLATQKGLVRYDGYDFKVYRHDEDDDSSVAGNYIQSLHVLDDTLYVGTYSDGVSIYHPSTDSFAPINAEPDNSEMRDIRALASYAGHVIVASRRSLAVYRPELQDLITLTSIEGCEQLLEQGLFTALAVHEHTLYVGSNRGVCQIELPRQGILTSPLRGQSVTPLRDVQVFDIQFHSAGEAWIATRDRGVGVWSLGTDVVEWIGVDPDDPRQLHHPWADDTALVDGAVWVGTAGGGIAIVDPESLEVIEHIKHQVTNTNGLVINDISSVFVDDAGLVWIGTWGSGMNRFNPANRAFKTLMQNPYDVQALAESDVRSAKEMRNGEVWLGGAAEGVQVVTAVEGLIRHYRPNPKDPRALQNGYVYAFEQLPNGEIWVATNQTGAYRYNESTDDFTRVTTDNGLTDDNIRALHAIDNDVLWLGTDAGLSKLNLSTLTASAITLASEPGRPFDQVIETLTTYRGALWVGTNQGLYRLPPGADTLEEVGSDPAAPLSDNFVADLHVDAKDQLWVVTAQGIDVLVSFDNGVAAFDSVNQRLGLPPGNLGEAIEEDSLGRMWVQSTLIDPATWSYQRISRKSGWNVGNQWIGSNTQLRDGTLLFGGTRGVLMVRPEDYSATTTTPRVTVTHAQIDAVKAPAGMRSPITLPPNVKSFSVEFSGLDFAGPAERRYQYKLDGYDEEWVTTDSSNRRATYSRLAPGEYSLSIRALDGSNEVVGNTLALSVVQQPAWFQTWWFLLSVGVGGAALVFGLVQWRIRALELQKQALDQLVSARTENIKQLALAGQDISASLDLGHVAAAVYRHVSEFMDTSVFAIATVDNASNSIKSVLHYQDGERLEAFSRPLSSTKSPAAWCVINRQVITVADLESEQTAFSQFELIPRSRPVRSVVFYPLMAKEIPVGVLCLQSYELSAYEDNELEMLKTIAAYAAAAIDNAAAHTKLNDAKAEIEKVSLTDQLTGLKNRRFLENLMPGEISRLRRLIAMGGNEQLGLILIDADFFKLVNDEFGHEAGDKVLVQLADIVRSTCREMDWAVRLGGEEFLMVARVQDHDQLTKLAERVRSRVAAHRFEINSETILRKSCSIGISTFPFTTTAPDALSWDEAINLADRALYMAKAEGRNRWVAVFAQHVSDADTLYARALEDISQLAATGEVIIQRSSISAKSNQPQSA